MPLVYRAMKKDDDGFPAVESSASGLGVRTGIDIDVDAHGNTITNDKGMSVSPAWRVMPVWRVPKRLRDKCPGARGPNSTFCFKTGTGPFQRAHFAEGLELVPDSSTHGCIAPTQLVPLVTYVSDLELTRINWQIDES
jgi:hypothetical protein